METYHRVLSRISNEGLSYFLQHYTSADSMPDKQGRLLFKRAEDALNKFEQYCREKCQEEGHDPDDY